MLQPLLEWPSMLDLAIAIVHHDPRNAAHRFRVPSGMVMEMAYGDGVEDENKG